VTREVAFYPFRQEAFAAALSPTSERGPATFGFHSRPKPVLLLACALGWLISAFHKAEASLRSELRAVTVGMTRALSISRANDSKYLSSPRAGGCPSSDCQFLNFLG
jgi:hypothetical protein